MCQLMLIVSFFLSIVTSANVYLCIRTSIHPWCLCIQSPILSQEQVYMFTDGFVSFISQVIRFTSSRFIHSSSTLLWCWCWHLFTIHIVHLFPKHYSNVTAVNVDFLFASLLYLLTKLNPIVVFDVVANINRENVLIARCRYFFVGPYLFNPLTVSMATMSNGSSPDQICTKNTCYCR